MFLQIVIVDACAVSGHVSVCAGDFSVHVCGVTWCTHARARACVRAYVCVCVCVLRSLKCMTQCHVHLL